MFQLSIKTQKWLLLALTAVLTLGAVYASIKFRMNIILALPIIVMIGLQLIYDYKPLYYLMIFSIPISIPLVVGSFSTDLPSETLMWVFTGIYLLVVLIHKGKKIKELKIYPYHIFIFLILFWTLFTTLTSEYPIRSFKFFLAKMWYIIAFVYMAEYIISDVKTIKKIFWCFFIPLVLVTLITIVRHAIHKFSFDWSNFVMQPYFLNHVIYGATLSLFLPFAWFARSWYEKKSYARYAINIGLSILVIGIFFSYARAAWGIIAALPFVIFAVRKQLLEKGIYISLVIAVLIVGYLVKDNNYYKFAPDYKTTVFHKGDLTGHLQATFSGSEISGMERFYRWVAAGRMFSARPIYGFGPSTFNQVYKRYTDNAFRTYVSDNEEQSTTHNYFLMTFSEQGFIGGLILIGFCVFILIKGAKVYHRVSDPVQKTILLASIGCIFAIVGQCLLNELIETDKIGAMFWLSTVFIHKIGIWNAKEV